MRTKKILILTAAMALALSVSGCGIFGGGNSQNSSGSNNTSSGSSSMASSSSPSSETSGSSSDSQKPSAGSSSSQASSSSADSSSSTGSNSTAEKVQWAGSYLMAEGSASQTSLNITNETDKKFDFQFYIKGISYAGTASIDSNSSNIATYQDPTHADYSLTFSFVEGGVMVAEKGVFPDAECSFEGNYAVQK